MSVFERTANILSAAALAVPLFLLAPVAALAQATPPGLSPGGISGAVGGGPAAGAIALPPPVSSPSAARPGIPAVAPYTPTFGGGRQSYGSGARALPEGAYVPHRKSHGPHRRHR